MNLQFLLQGSGHGWWVLPAFVFFARVADVSLGTLRLVFVSRGWKRLAPVVGFFEVFIWICAIAQVVRNLDNMACYFAYAAGYACGTFVGLAIEQRLALGTVILRIITQQEGDALAAELRRNNFGVTCLDAEGALGRVKIIFSIIRRGSLTRALATVKSHNPNAFYTVEDVRAISRKPFPLPDQSGWAAVAK
jgi:uncharacterized protein YebE (UPF0316 family)